MKMLILDNTGHTKTIWDADNEDEVENAKATFDRMIKKGYQAFKVKADGTEGAVMKKFDPTAEKMILAPALQGG